MSRARRLLQERLIHRGLSFTAESFAGLLVAGTASTTLRASLFESTLKASFHFATAGSAAQLVSAPTAALVEGGLKVMAATKLKVAAALILAVSLVTGAVVMAHQVLGAKDAITATQEQNGLAVAEEAKESVVVNGRVLGPDDKPIAGAEPFT